MKVNVILFFFGVFLLLFSGCKHEPLYPLSNLSGDSLRFKSISCNKDTAYFYNDVGPLIISNCAIKGCHDGNSGNSPTLTNYSSIMKSVVSGQIDQSKLYTSLITSGEKLMPLAPMASFTAAQIELVAKWISQGAHNNGCSMGTAGCNLTNVTYVNSVVPIMQTYCNGCHSATSYASAGGGFKIATYSDFSNFAKSGLLMNSLNNIGVPNGMPKGGNKLSTCNLSKIGLVVQKIVDSLNTVVCDTTNVTFPVTVLPIMQTYCLSCHSTANAASAGAGYKLETLADFTAVAKTGLLMNSINQIAGISAMPKGLSKLSACNISKIKILVRSFGGTTTPPVSSCSPDTVYFTNTLGPLIVSSCAMTGCHNGSGRNPTLVTYTNIRNQVTPGFPTLSRLYTVLNGGEEPMPPSAPFTNAQKLIVSKWIEQGAKNNSCVDTNCDTTAVTYSSTVSSIISTNCLGCHGAAATTKLDSYTNVKAVVTSVRLLGAIQHLPGFIAMPPGGTLSVCDINKIKAWINKGALNN